MNILALEPFYGGSHKAFLDSWRAVSRHDWTILGLPGYKWKWRMRHASVTLAEQADALLESGKSFDLIFCSDMLNLPEWRGLLKSPNRDIPAIIYFHENQLTYPSPEPSLFDYHFAYTNFISALGANQVWFNSAFHKNSFLNALATSGISNTFSNISKR